MEVLAKDEVIKLIADATEPLLRRINELELLTDEWVDTKTALRLTGIKTDNTLRKERERPDAIIQCKASGRLWLYSRTSIVKYNEYQRLFKEQGFYLRKAA